jgi:hypothetical protein
MAMRALLIGSQTYGLAGVNADVHLMARTLERRGFEVRIHVDGDATRAALIAAYEALIEETPPGATDPTVVYYSGHGGRTALDGWEELQRRGLRSHLRYLVPYDMAATTESDFRGLLAEELSDLQRRLTAKTANVTTILDCCYSGTMSRNLELMPKAVLRAFPASGALPRLAELDAVSPVGWLDDANPLAVRVVACDPFQSAYERDGALGERHGVLTEELVLALRTLGDRPISWRVVGDRIRRSVTAALPLQRPDVEGPADRVVFSLETRGRPGALPVTLADGRARIEAARLFGVGPGDRFLLVDANDEELQVATVTGVDGDRAELDAAPAAAVGAVPSRVGSARGVRIEAESAAELGALVAASPLLHVTDDQTAVATIADGLFVRDSEGLAMNADPIPAGAAVELAERIARAERLRALPSGDLNPRQIAVELATHASGERVPRARTGERLYPGERVSLTIISRSDTTLYVALFDIDTAHRAVMINSDEPSGWRLEPGQTRVVGGTDGTALVWDAGVPADGARLETFLIIAATRPQDFSRLEVGRTRGEPETPRSELEALLGEAGTGVRGWPTSGTAAEAVRYRAEPVDFYLVPGERPAVGEPPFAVVELPSPATRALQPRSAIDPPRRVAVRLVALTVKKNKALFRAAVRVDAIVITRRGAQAVATPFTQRFPAIADGDLLPADNLLLFLDDVEEFLDIALWVNRDDRKGADLAEMFAGAIEDTHVQTALATVGGLVIAAPQVAAAVGVVAAVATIVSTGSRLIEKMVGKEIGLYRTSFLAYERFGTGRQPASGMREAQGMEFACEIIGVT